MSKQKLPMEVWRCVIGSEEFGDSTKHEYHVFAESAAEAEQKGLALEEKLNRGSRISNPACYKTEFVFNIEG